MWSLETLDLQRTLQQTFNAEVRALLAVGGRVWAVVGSDVVVWGRGARGGGAVFDDGGGGVVAAGDDGSGCRIS